MAILKFEQGQKFHHLFDIELPPPEANEDEDFEEYHFPYPSKWNFTKFDTGLFETMQTLESVKNASGQPNLGKSDRRLIKYLRNNCHYDFVVERIVQCEKLVIDFLEQEMEDRLLIPMDDAYCRMLMHCMCLYLDPTHLQITFPKKQDYTRPVVLFMDFVASK
ncbi:hypothetical protein EDD86DRAFT_247862 [Gorgonomyces haynaldii]|nr:hypothetical protein EDD86DRAFT_247862 [Gorgonomyces haynaldii]